MNVTMADNANLHLGDDGEIPSSPHGEFKVKRGLPATDLALQQLEQLEVIIAAYRKVQSSSRYADLSDINAKDIHTLLARARAAIERISGGKSVYSHHAKSILSRGEWDSHKLMAVIGIVESLHADLEAGYLETFEEAVRADIYADLLETANAVYDAGNANAAANIAGTIVVNHLWKLADKNNLVLANPQTNQSTPTILTELNNQLANHNVYNKLDQARIMSWLELWVKAVSEQSSGYSKEQINLMLHGIRDFLSRYPA